MDLQTFTIHFPKGKIKQISKPRVGNYPVALVPGQFTDYYKVCLNINLLKIPLQIFNFFRHSLQRSSTIYPSTPWVTIRCREFKMTTVNLTVRDQTVIVQVQIRTVPTPDRLEQKIAPCAVRGLSSRFLFVRKKSILKYMHFIFLFRIYMDYYDGFLQ